ncbi:MULTISPECIES: hypothetical protein [unclassified Streptomyces]|nr:MULTISPECIES: hypothetical protein [unclassified Streptomyces]WSR23319.1 hypothetical protein OG573_32130 [Streptomyces sp. NBC_01205]
MDYVLHYPYPRIRDDAWLKAAALYLPRIAGLGAGDIGGRR